MKVLRRYWHILLPLAALVVLTAVCVAQAAVYSADKPNTCEAPCTVVFPEGMEEDEFQIDYANDSLRVWRVKP